MKKSVEEYELGSYKSRKSLTVIRKYGVKMGRRDKKYSINLKDQIRRKLEEMLHAGEGTSKRDAKRIQDTSGKIFSYSTFDSYKKCCIRFANYVADCYPSSTTLKSAKRHVGEYLQMRVDAGLSAWTIALERQALCKLYNVTPVDEEFFKVPKRRREDIKRSRGETKSDKHFSEKNHAELIEFSRATGCRRNVLERLTGDDLYSIEELKDELKRIEKKENRTHNDEVRITSIKEALELFPEYEYFLLHHRDKGGKDRFAPIIGKNTEKVVERIKDTKPGEKVWLYVPKNFDNHACRADYCLNLYKAMARPIAQIPYDTVNSGSGKRFQSEVYVCRMDEKGKKLDKLALYKTSKALGHNRISIIPTNYLRGL